MNKILKTSSLLAITAILAISVIAISVMPEAEAKKDHDEKNKFKDIKKNLKKYLKGKPDFAAWINTPNIPDHYNGEKGVAMFWVKGKGDNMKIHYKVILHKIGIGEIGEDGTGQAPDRKRYPHYVWKLHVHPAPDGVHDASQHYLNIVGPDDDSQLKIKKHTYSGKWDNRDAENSKAHMLLHKTRPPASVIDEMCSGDTDINVHTESHLQIRGFIVPTSNFCDKL